MEGLFSNLSSFLSFFFLKIYNLILLLDRSRLGHGRSGSSSEGALLATEVPVVGPSGHLAELCGLVDEMAAKQKGVPGRHGGAK